MLHLRRDYVPSWTEADAFREWYQNWKDAIIQNFNLAPRPFILEQNTTNTEIQITAHRPNEAAANFRGRELLGYIKYTKRTGTVELANFNAALEIQHLNLEGTSKRHNPETAGVHGEGLKLAALVMTRKNRNVRISSSSAYWSFGFRGLAEDKLHCQITKPAASTIKKHKDSLLSKTLDGQFRENLTSYIHQDVSVMISTAKEHDIITQAQFWRWTEVSIDLHCPSLENIILTSWGDLLLDPAFAGRIYLKGLQVSSINSGGQKYTFGYDFVSGIINRDRERIMDQTKEAGMIAKIWEAAVNGRPDLMKRYIALFNDNNNPDVDLADRVVSKRMAEDIWQQLLMDEPESFFYSSNSDWSITPDQNYLIETELKKKPHMLTKRLWNTLRRFKLVQTPEEHIHDKFLSSRVIPIPEDNFAQSIDRMLRAAMRLNYSLGRLSLVYVKSKYTTVGVRVDWCRSRILIHEKWLHFDEAHKNTSCDFSKLGEAQRKQAAVFACDHVMDALFETILKAVIGEGVFRSSSISNLRSRGRELFRQTPRDIQVTTGSVPGQLRVNWTYNDGGVILKHHRENIFYKIPLSACSATFDGLDPLLTYFPVVARYEYGSFFGIVPESIAPPDESMTHGQNQSMKTYQGGDCSTVGSSKSSPESPEWLQDEQTWLKWHTEDFPNILSQMFATRQACECNPRDTFTNVSFESARLNFKFEKNRYVVIKDNSDSLGEYIAFVHDVLPGSVECQNTAHLSISKYSFFQSTSVLWDSKPPLSDDNDTTPIELLLHFSEPRRMGTPSDSEVLAIHDIDRAESVRARFDIVHCVQTPDNLDADKIFCRFARSVHDDSIDLIPISQHLLPPQDRRSNPGFTGTASEEAIDLTPGVLGLMEGFCSAGYQPFAAFGFNESSDATWKIRHQTCPLFDGNFPEILEDIDSGKLLGPSWPSEDSPTTVLATGSNANFALSKGNKKLPSLKDFLYPLYMAENAMFSRSPDFAVVQLSPAVFHPMGVNRLCDSIVSFLQHGNAIKIDVSSVKKFCVPQSRRLVTMIVSSCHGLSAVPIHPAHQTPDPVGQPEGELTLPSLADLSFENPRTSQTGFVCSLPPRAVPDENTTSIRCYNHNTGRKIPEEKARIVDLDSNDINVTTHSRHDLVHPTRLDSLTVRELARIQGFPDDFVFYGSERQQYEHVTFAQPPAAARAAAECIKTVIKRFREVKLRDGEGSQRPNKRRREDNGPSQEVSREGA
ncbi:unnamed protein product [Colletotrichum noveboracense]|uniref:DNA (cytosine-5-)-methyltransferase n=1 Tax=Colletotrichum noveboracense TaxID=2664923 RepID=A0A9W4RXR0_9PEZI|nr:unnamed protein product [Colletotrichum noveboracense]